MSNWVSFSERLPTMADADCDGKVVILYNKKRFGHVFLEMEAEIHCGDFDDCHWLENVPKFTRTLEDVAREYLDTRKIPPRLELAKEMREILEREDGGVDV